MYGWSTGFDLYRAPTMPPHSTDTVPYAGGVTMVYDSVV